MARKLNIPTFAPSSPESQQQRSVPLAEQVRNFDEQARSSRGSSRSNREQRRREARQERRTAQERRVYDLNTVRDRRSTRVKAALRDPAAKLKMDMRKAENSYVSSLARSRITQAKTPPKKQRQKMSDLHKAYASMMVFECIQPIRQGFGANNIISTIGMGSAMWMLSPNFRNVVGDIASQMRTAVLDRIDPQKRRDRKVIEQGEKSREALDRYSARTGRGRDEIGGLFAKKHRKRLERIEHMERGYRDPFTEHSAALTQVGLAESAYREMRRPGANPAAIQDSYESSLKTLYQYMEADGLDMKEVEQNMRTIVGQRMAADPSTASVFTELGHGRFAKSEPTEVVLPNGKRTMAWTGNYEDAFGGKKVTAGTFTLRPPMTREQHAVAMEQTVVGEMVSAKSVGELNDVMNQYMVGSATRMYPDAVDSVEDPQVRARMGRARSMFLSMQQDGVSSEDQKLLYMGSYINAMHQVEKLNPELAREWAQQYGAEWEHGVREAMGDYEVMAEDLMHEEQDTVHVVVDNPDAPMNRFEADSQGRTVDLKAEPAYGTADEEIVDAEIVEDEDEVEAEEQTLSTDAAAQNVRVTQSRDAEVEATAEEAISGLGTPEDEVSARKERRRVKLESNLAVDFDPSVDDMRVNRNGQWSAGGAKNVGELVDRMSDHMADDIYNASLAEGDRDGATWVARHAYRSRARALGKLDPSRPEFQGDPALYNERVEDLRADHAHAVVDGSVKTSDPRFESTITPWDNDVAANTRAREMFGMAQSLSDAGVPADMQNELHAVAYARALEKIVKLDPAFEADLNRSAMQQGAPSGAWRSHEFSQALRGTANSKGKAPSYQELTQSLGLKSVEDLRIPSAVHRDDKRAQLVEAAEQKAEASDYARETPSQRNSERMRRHRQNMAYNGFEVGSGRFEQPAQPQGGDDLSLG